MAAIRGHPRSYEVIRGEGIGGRSSEVIRGHPRSSEVIRGHQNEHPHLGSDSRHCRCTRAASHPQMRAHPRWPHRHPSTCRARRKWAMSVESAGSGRRETHRRPRWRACSTGTSASHVPWKHARARGHRSTNCVPDEGGNQRPSACTQRPSACTQRPSACTQRPTACTQRPSLHDCAR
jgi:hypothetical protein